MGDFSASAVLGNARPADDRLPCIGSGIGSGFSLAGTLGTKAADPR